jgi:hypothetical protein
MRLMLREVAAGIGVSYASMSMDYSQSNYSSSRLALLDDRDLWRVFQQFFIRSFREPLHREWLELAILARAIPAINLADYVGQPKTYEAVSFKPRGWSWIDPAKEVEAYLRARRAGFMSTAQIASLTGAGDLEDLWTQIAAENEDSIAKGLTLTSNPGQVLEGREVSTPSPSPEPTEPLPADAEAGDENATARSMEIRELADAIRNAPAPVVNNHIAPQPVQINTPPVNVTIEPTQVTVEPAQVNVQMPEQPISVHTPDVKVDVAAPQVHVEIPQAKPVESMEIIERDSERRARVIRTERGDFEVMQRDANGDAKVVRRRDAA